MKPRAEPVTAVPFSRNRTIEVRQVEYDVTDPGKVLANVSQLDVFTGQFLSSDGSQQLNPRDINATAVLQSGRVILAVCFNRTDPSFGAPGSYLGTVSIVDPRVNRTDVAFNITMSYPCWQLVFALFVAMLLPAILYVWFLKGSFQSNTGLTVRKLEDWIFCRTTLMAIGAGIAAAIGVFSAIYAKAPAWGTDWTARPGFSAPRSRHSSPRRRPSSQQGATRNRLKSPTETRKYPQQAVMISDTERNRFQLGITARYPAVRQYV